MSGTQFNVDAESLATVKAFYCSIASQSDVTDESDSDTQN